jgi:quinol monooxygenase YgiN
MVITILEARIEPDMVPALLAAYQNGLSHLPPQMNQTFLIQSVTDKTVWRILSVWKSREALDEMRSSRETPEGILMFRAAGAEDPQLSIFDVTAFAP